MAEARIFIEYKCRRCGTVHPEEGCNSSAGLENLHDLASRKTIYHVHFCQDGGRGVSDLIGHTPPIPIPPP